MCRASVTALPVEDAVFDLVICYHVLEHVLEDRLAMSELARVLHSDALMLAHVPIDRDVTFEDPGVTDPEDRRRLFGQEDHVRRYGRDFVERLQVAGFCVQVSDLASTLPESEVRRYGLLRDEVIYVCRPTSKY
jgi:ubiquinone/menaquinone biosynthesis C-methylase UbiE